MLNDPVGNSYPMAQRTPRSLGQPNAVAHKTCPDDSYFGYHCPYPAV